MDIPIIFYTQVTYMEIIQYPIDKYMMNTFFFEKKLMGLKI